MPTPPLKLSWRPQGLAYGWFARTLQDDPTLRAVVKTWVVRSPAGERDEAPPDGRNLPWVRLTPDPAGSKVDGKLGDRIIRLVDLIVTVEVAAPGRDPAESLALADATWDAIFRRYHDPASARSRRLAFLNAVREESSPAAGAPPAPDANYVLAAGQFRLTVRG